MCACRAGFWPCPAVSTWPRMVSETSSGETPARSRAALMVEAPSSCAGLLAKLPLKLPTAVRAAEAMTILVMGSLHWRTSPGSGSGRRAGRADDLPQAPVATPRGTKPGRAQPAWAERKSGPSRTRGLQPEDSPRRGPRSATGAQARRPVRRTKPHFGTPDRRSSLLGLAIAPLNGASATPVQTYSAKSSSE